MRRRRAQRPRADSRGGVYLSISGAGLFYANPQGVVSQYGEGVQGANGIILSPDEKTLYVTNGPVLVAFDVRPDGSLTNQREFGKLHGGQSGDGSSVDAQGECMWPRAPPWMSSRRAGTSSAAFPGRRGCMARPSAVQDKKTLFAIVFYGAWGTPSARNRVIAIPMIAQGYTGRAK